MFRAVRICNSTVTQFHHRLCIVYSHSVAENVEYNPSAVENGWSGKWSSARPTGSKFYVLSMFPYPSGRLHMGHVRVYTISDTLARFHRMTGKEVLHPMGWDAFGLPAENAAIDRGVDPATWTRENIDTMRGQLDRMGCHFDWDKEVTTCSPDYYQWTQWLFLQLYNKGLAYKKKAMVNWDPVDNTVLANEQVDENGRSWRSGALVEQRMLDQWFFRITEYADALLDGLQGLDWPDKVKNIQSEWIGKSEGVYFDFQLSNGGSLRVFTTASYSLYGVTFLAISTQHTITQTLSSEALAEIAGWSSASQEKNGVFSGLYAIHPLTGDKLPLFVANYVLNGYGTEAVMGVPGHDERDRQFAEEHSIKIVTVAEDDILINSEQFSGLPVVEGGNAIRDHTQSLGIGGIMTTYKLRDWLISRQRYWGAPIPILYCDKCGVVPVSDDQLPVLLPDNAQFTGRGGSLLATSREWRQSSCGRADCCAVRESDTMDTFVDSSWYYLRFASRLSNSRAFSDEVNHWMPVDIYVGGIEHAHLHLLYARFINHVLHDLNLVDTKEPFQKLIAQGMVQGLTYKDKDSGRYLRPEEDHNAPNVLVSWEKMSKSKYNGVDPEDILEKYGADSVRLFMLFKAAPEFGIQWDDQAIQGVHRWLHRLWRLVHHHIPAAGGHHTQDKALEAPIISATHKAIKQVSEAMSGQHTLNTALPELMILSNTLRAQPDLSHSLAYHQALCALVTLLAPMAPYVSEELWRGLAIARRSYQQETPIQGGVFEQTWPKWEEQLLHHGQMRGVVIQVNGKKKGVVNVPSSIIDVNKPSELKAAALQYAMERGLLTTAQTTQDLGSIIVASTGLLVNIVLKAR